MAAIGGTKVVVRKLIGTVAAALLLAGPAQGLVLDATGDLVVRIATLDPITLPSVLSITVNGSGGAVGGHITSMTVPASPFGTTGFQLDVTDPGASPIEGIQASLHNDAISVAGAVGGGLAGAGRIFGVAKVCLFADCSGFVPANVSIPVSVIGSGGSVTVDSFVNVTVVGAPWTTGTANVGTVTERGFAHGPASLTSSTAAPSGVVSLVTPIFISTNIAASATLPAFAILDIRVAPEPGLLLMQGAGVAVLIALGRRRMRG